MPKYQFIVGVSLGALEGNLNQIAADAPNLKLNQVFFAQGTGFVAVVEHSACEREKAALAATPQVAGESPTPRKSQKKS